METNPEVIAWIEAQKAEKRQRLEERRRAEKDYYSSRTFTAHPSWRVTVSLYTWPKNTVSPKKEKHIKKTSTKKPEIDPETKKKMEGLDTSQYALITDDAEESNPVIDDDWNVIDSVEYMKKSTWNEYWNLITNKNWGKKWEIDNGSPEPNEIENSNDNIEQIIQEIWNKIKELELLFENLKNMVHSKTK